MEAPNNNMTIPTSELEKIQEYVMQGIVASKQVDSNMWGEMKIHLLNIDNKLERHEEILTEVRDRVKIQNGRTRTLENWRNYTAGAIAIITLVVLPLLWDTMHKVSAMSEQVTRNTTKLEAK